MPEVVARGWFVRHGMSLSPGGRLGQYPPDKMADAHSNTNPGVTYIYVLKCITHRRPLPTPSAPLRTELPFSFRRLQPSSVSPATRLHGHRTSSLFLFAIASCGSTHRFIDHSLFPNFALCFPHPSNRLTRYRSVKISS